MTARLKRNVTISTFGFFTSLMQCIHFSMTFAGSLMPAFTNNLVIFDNDTANTRIRVSGIKSVFGKLNGSCHIKFSRSHDLFSLFETNNG